MTWRSSWSLQRRLAVWMGAALTLTVAALTATTVKAELELVRALNAAAGESLVLHLAQMPEFRGTSAEARAHLSSIAPALSAAGATMELVPASNAGDEGVLASRGLLLLDGHYAIQYRAVAPWLLSLARRSVLLHVLHGIGAVAVLLAGTTWILRRHLVDPLARIAHQVRFMGSGGGWSPKLPEADAELAGVEEALMNFGPALHRQVEQWLEGERRAAVAGALSVLRGKLGEPHRRALAFLGELQARDYVSAAGKPRLRLLVAEMESLTVAIDEFERKAFAPV